MTKIAGSGSINQRHGSADPDPPQNVMDPQHWSQGLQSLGSNLVDSNKLLSRSCEQFIGLGELASGAGPGTYIG
jgi:hypothetical protein